MAELVQVNTADGLRLDGLWTPPRGKPGEHPAFLMVHGTGSNFTAVGTLETFSEGATSTGAGVLRINTRGHDGMAHIPPAPGHRGIKGGAAFEVIADARHDLEAWIAWLADRGCPRIVLVGHSMGAVKCLSFVAEHRPSRVIAVIAISPPRFNHSDMAAHMHGDAFLNAYRQASNLLAAGKGETVIESHYPLPLFLTARGFMEKYGPDDRYDYVRWLPSFPLPLFLTIGSQTCEENMGFMGVPEYLSSKIDSMPNVTFQLVEGADISFSNDRAAPFRMAWEWLATHAGGPHTGGGHPVGEPVG